MAVSGTSALGSQSGKAAASAPPSGCTLPTIADDRRRCHILVYGNDLHDAGGQGTERWRPVQATNLAGDLYCVSGSMPADEEWADAPGAIERCERSTCKESESELRIAGAAD
jgi:hypothetical protein